MAQPNRSLKLFFVFSFLKLNQASNLETLVKDTLLSHGNIAHVKF